MSTYSKQTKHPVTGEWHEATWIDDFYGRHNYGVQFPDGGTYNPEKTKLETRDDEQMTSTEKIDEMVRDFCSVAPKSKSEVRQRISQAIKEAEQSLIKQILALPTHPAGYAKERMISPSDIEKILLTDK